MGDDERADETNQWDLRTTDYYYLTRVEYYLIYKYAPELVDEMRVTFGNARLKNSNLAEFRERDEIFHDPESLMRQIQNDMQSLVNWRPKKARDRRAPLKRPGIGAEYQEQFKEL